MPAEFALILKLRHRLLKTVIPWLFPKMAYTHIFLDLNVTCVSHTCIICALLLFLHWLWDMVGVDWEGSGLGGGEVGLEVEGA